MGQCLVKTPEYRTKLAQSGIPEFIYNAAASLFIREHGRFPNLDELPGSNSSKHLKDSLSIKEDNTAKINDILAVTNTSSPEEANIVINDSHPDLETEIIPLNKDAIVNIQQRPSEYIILDNNELPIQDDYIKSGIVFNALFDKLRKLYGINLTEITNKQLHNSQWRKLPEIQGAAAFVANNNIYINTDLADIDAPIHEMTHILLGSIRFKNPQLYQQLVSVANQFENFAEIQHQNPNRVMQDIQEEAFVQEVAKYLAGQKNAISSLDPQVLYEIHYNIKRLLDSALMGNYSVKSFDDSELYQMSLRDLAKEVNSTIMNATTLSSLDDAALHRMLSNTKSDLMKKGKLREEC